MHTIHLVKEFHRAFGHPINDDPTDPGNKQRLLRFRLVFEELMEFGRAIGIAGLADVDLETFEAQLKEALSTFEILPGAGIDHVLAADALGDLDYVVQGSNLAFGYPAEEVVLEIHRSNMSKLGEDGKPLLDEHGKVVKGPNYAPPNILSILQGG